MALRKSASREDPQPYILKKNYKKAAEIYRKHIKESPDDANLYLRLGDVLVSDGHKADAVGEYKHAARLYGDAGFLLKAIGVNKKIVKLDPSQDDVHQQLSELYEARGLLASPAPAAAPAPAPAAGFQFDMEASSDGSDLDLDLGSQPAVELAAEPPPAADPADPEFSVDDLSAALADLPEGDFATPAPAAAAPAAAQPAEISIDDLGDALADIPFDTPVASTAATDEVSAGRTPLFSDFTSDELVEVIKQMGHESCQQDAVVVKEGDAGDALYVIVTGSVRVVTTMGNREVELATLEEGAFFGEGSLITGKPRTATIISNEESEFLTLTKDSFEALASDKPRVREVMIEFYQKRAESTVKAMLGANH